MKLSEAILLGSTVLAAKAGQQYSFETEAGCALGMAALATGCRFRRAAGPVPERDRRTLGAEGVWGTWVLRMVMRPCECLSLQLPREMRIKDIIAHLFDCHVAEKKNWTLDQLVAWVQTWEPRETRPPLSQDFVPFAKAISAPRRAEEREAEQEWKRVRQAFEARHRPQRSITKSVPGNK